MHPKTRDDIRNLSQWIQDTMEYDSFLETLQGLIPEFPGDAYAHLSSSFGSNAVITVYRLETPADAVDLLWKLRDAGYKRLSTSTSAGAVKISYEADNDRYFTVHLNFKENENQRCRTVKVGEEVQPVYKTLCGKELEEWEAEHDA